MNGNLPDLRRFERRVRLARAFRYGCWGTFAGSTAATVLAVLDLVGTIDCEWPLAVAVIATGTVLGSMYGIFLPISKADLAKSIDRRSGLEDRLSSALLISDSAFSDQLQADAEQKLAKVSEVQAFPIRFGKGQAGMVFSFTLPLIVFFVSYHHLLMSAAGRQEREETKAQAAQVQHVLTLAAKSPEEAPRQADLVKQLQRLQRDLERGKLDREAAKAKADKISEDANRLMHEENKRTVQSLDSAQAALDREHAELKADQKEDGADKGTEAASLDKMSQQKLEELAAKSPSQEKLDSLSKQISDLEKKLGDPKLSEQERNALQQQLNQLKQEMQQLKLSEAAQKMLERMRNNPEFKKLQEMMEKLRQNAGKMDQGQQSLSKEELEEMEKQLEELAKQLKTDKDMEEYLKKLEEAMKEAEAAGNLQQMAMLMGMIQMGGAPDTTPGPPNGVHLNMSDKEEAGKGTTHTIGIRAEQKPNAQPSPYIEQKGMARLTGPSAIPLLRDIPASTRKAEEAISKQRVPKEHQERVKKYFESLEGKP